MNWKDATTYTRQQPGKPAQQQTAWELNTGHVRIWISNAHRYYPGEWVYVCYNVGVSDAKPLDLKDDVSPETAQKRAVAWVGARLEKMLKSLEQ